ncbi:hypothetical protein BdWA1_003102 [Babesia duncani]|uniref:Uncharacterized protein n=1 Tax=Babesia duncani TaxID=323732 RepID=A0AAD9PIY7_9APIC|nr:hypothetical protein BdWA1_003102 [Babesia duncani]
MEFNEIQRQLDVLSKIQLDITHVDNNVRLFSAFDKLVARCVDYISDDTIERELIQEHLNQRGQSSLEYQSLLNKETESIAALQEEFRDALKIQEIAKTSLDDLKRDTSTGNRTLHHPLSTKHHQLVLHDNLKQMESTLEAQVINLEKQKCKIQALQEQNSFKNSKDDVESNQNSLKMALLNKNDNEAHLALLSESLETDQHVWHRLTVSLKECNVKMCNFLWETIYNALDCKPHFATSNEKQSGYTGAISNVSSLHL